jgi:prolyl-tRNA synthetase
MFKISFENEKNETEFAWQTSWGLTTRSIGTLILHHGDDSGLILPPAVVKYQVVIVPIYKKDIPSDVIVAACKGVKADLEKNGVRVYFDESDHNTPGFKYNYWEMRGVPFRFEIG